MPTHQSPSEGNEPHMFSGGAVSGPERQLQREAAIELLAYDPSVYHSMDYHGQNRGNSGHGRQFESGPLPVDPLMKRNNRDWQLDCEKAAPFTRPTWHHGEGVVGKIISGGFVGLILYFQQAEPSSRPDFTFFVVVPEDPKFAGALGIIEQEPAMLLDVFSRIAPGDASHRTQGVRLVSDKVLDLQALAKLPHQPIPESVPYDYSKETRRDRVARGLGRMTRAIKKF